MEMERIYSFSSVSGDIPEDILKCHKKLLKSYFRAQVFIHEGKLRKARRLFGFLEKYGLIEFEDEHPEVLAKIDILVRGETNQLSSVPDHIKTA